MSKSKKSDLAFLTIQAIFLLGLTALLSACNARQVEVSSGSGNEDYVLLGLLGYNYTDRDIDNYSVDGAGGGSVLLSSSTSGGSGVTCCVKLSKNYVGPIRVKIRWQVDGCKYVIKNERTGEAESVRYLYYKEAEIDVHRVVGENPKHIETHFYPNGTVQARLVEHGSRPLLILDGNRPDKSFFPRCKDDKNPEE